MLQPQIPDKAGRGALCEKIERLTREIIKVTPEGEKPDKVEAQRLSHRLDKEREKFHKLYNYTPPKGGEAENG